MIHQEVTVMSRRRKNEFKRFLKAFVLPILVAFVMSLMFSKIYRDGGNSGGEMLLWVPVLMFSAYRFEKEQKEGFDRRRKRCR